MFLFLNETVELLDYSIIPELLVVDLRKNGSFCWGALSESELSPSLSSKLSLATSGLRCWAKTFMLRPGTVRERDNRGWRTTASLALAES